MGPSAGEALLRWTRVVLVAVLTCATLVPAPAHAEVTGNLEWSATIDGRLLTEIDSNRPLELGVTDQVPVVLDLRNVGTEELRVRSVRLEGRAMGLSFFSFTIRIDVVLKQGESTSRQFNVDLDDLARQATGLIPSRFQLLDQDRNVLVNEPMPVDVKGSLLSVYGLFGLSVALVTIALLATLLLSIWRGRLAARNRWQRALFFLPVGLGIGLTLTFTLSALRLLLPSAGTWLTLVLACGAIAFLIGYFLPLGPADDDEDAGSQSQSPDDADSEFDEGDESVTQAAGRSGASGPV